MDINKAYDIAIEQHKRFLSQRTTSYNFSLILFGFLITALVKLWELAFAVNASVVYSIFAALVSFAIIMLAYLFCGVDARTLHFLDNIKKLLQQYEECMLRGDATTTMLYFTKDTEIRKSFNADKKPFFRKGDKKDKSSWFHTFFLKPKLGSLINFTYVAFFILGFVSIGISILSFF